MSALSISMRCRTVKPKRISDQPQHVAGRLLRTVGCLCAAVWILSHAGCTAILAPIDSVPANRVPPQLLAEPQANKRPIDVARLRQLKPANYILDADDILGVYIERILGNPDEAPPVQFPEPGSDLSPSIGFPIPIREDGTISLPLIDPIPLRGLTLQQAEELIKRTYVEAELLQERARVIITLMKERTYRVFVVRQDNTNYGSAQVLANRSQQAVSERSDLSSRGFVLQLPAYKNDVLNALSLTGGLPGVNAKAEVRILRGDRVRFAERDAQLEEFSRAHGPNEFPYGIIPPQPDDQNTIRIPLRLRPNEVPRFNPEDIVLRDGDIVYVDNRETEVYYTGGLLGGGEFTLPRDYDLDVLTAVARSGQSLGIGSQQQRGTGALFGAVGSVPPSELIILRPLPGRRQIAIQIDMNRAINDPRQRLLVRAGDTLILRYTPREELINFGIVTFFTFGISEIFRGGR
jgi:protein involved in polysaccharide export with SLBB domain